MLLIVYNETDLGKHLYKIKGKRLIIYVMLPEFILRHVWGVYRLYVFVKWLQS